MTMKKFLAIVLMLTMLMSIFVGCGKDDGNAVNPDVTNPNGDNVDKPDNGEKTTITIGIPENTLVEDYDTNDYICWLEEQTGYDLVIQPFAANHGDAATQLSVMLLNDNSTLPDILLNFSGLTATTWRMYGEDGYFVSLTDYFEDREGKAKPWFDRLDEIGVEENYIERVLLAARANDGEIYAFPKLEFGFVDNMDYAVSINQTWLDELNLEMPTDPDSLYEVLKAFKAAHPGCYPLAGLGTTQLSGDVVSWLVNMFTYSDDDKYLTLSADGKTVEQNFTSDGYRKGLEFCNKLYKEGLLYVVSSRAELSALLNVEDEAMSVGCFVGHPTLVLEVDHPSVFNYSAMPIWGYAVTNENNKVYANFITEAAVDHGTVDACWNLLMTMCSQESSIRQRYGIYGEDWEWADEGTKSFLGFDAEIKLYDSTAFNTVGNENLKAICATILNNCENERVQMSDDMSDWEKYKYSMQADQYEYFYAAAEKNPTYIFPTISLTEDERDEYNDLIANCKSYIQQYRTAFVSGDAGIDPNNDNDWNAYVKGLEDCGIADWLALYQKVYNERYIDTVIG